MNTESITNFLSNESVSTVFTVFLIPVLTILAKYIVTYFTAKTKAVEKESAATTLDKHYTIAYNEIKEAVHTVNQVYVNDLKERGEFTEECYQVAKDRAKVEFKTNCPSSVMETLNKELTPEEFELWIDSKIDCAIAQIKAENKKGA